MKVYNIKVNGKTYEVEVELAGETASGNESSYQTSVKEQLPKQQQEQPAAAKTPEPSGSTGSLKINSPMPGTILRVDVKVGETVKKGQVLCVLEAMKMENEITSPKDGTVASVNVSAGANVDSGALLISLD